MQLLFVGGTSFVGRHMAAEALARGHDVTLFHRGKTNPDLFPNAEHVLGDRSTDLEALAGRTWDAAIDVCAYVPREVRQAGEVLAGGVGRYLYVSSVSAYRATDLERTGEDAPLLGPDDLDDPDTEDVTDETYGPLEAMCEAAAEEAFPGRTIVLRPTYVVGPHDSTDRFTYWVRRAVTGGDVLAPGPPDAPMQLIDARDLGAFAIDLVEHEETGPFLGVGPQEPITWAETIAACIETVGHEAVLTWVDPAFLEARGVEIASAFPLWEDGSWASLMRCDPARSLAAGLRLRPLAETIRDTAAWDRDRGTPPLRVGIDREREAELLDAWRLRL
jgi:2'-hydroxyisoflavone reductase